MEKTMDEAFMSRCLSLAQRGRGHVSPNPMVGAVIVKNGKIIAKGYHKKVGAPHAEIEALKKLKFKAKGATLYCNLEPCFHQGRTPPCVHQIIKSGIKRVVIAHLDPNPRVHGKSIKLLRKRGVLVSVGVFEREARYLNRFFLTWITQKRPYVILKVAMSLDGKIGLKNNKRILITGRALQKRVHELRSQVDAILVGVNTVIVDDPQLNVRFKKKAKQPVRIILDTHLRTPPESRIFKARGGEVWVVTTMDDGRCTGTTMDDRIEAQRVEILSVASDKTGLISLSHLLCTLAQREISSLLVEGGSRVFSSFMRAGFYDELIFMRAPKMLGERGLDWCEDISAKNWSKGLELHGVKQYEKDTELRFFNPQATIFNKSPIRESKAKLM